MRHARRLVLGLALLVTASCGGGGHGDEERSQGPPPDLTGWWVESWDDMDEPLGYSPDRLIELVDDGTAVVYDGRTLVKEGWRLRSEPQDAGDSSWQEWRLDILDPAHVEGRVEQYVDGARTWGQHRQLTATSEPPDGRLAINGHIGGSEVAVDSSMAYAVEYTNEGWDTALRIHAVRESTYTWLWLGHQSAPHIPAGTYEVGSGDEDVNIHVHTSYRGEAGATGNVVLTHSSSTRVAGWYVVELEDGNTIAGSFDVPIRISTPWRS